ncbi:CueP family metal-binding protein [Paenibacillus yanchengensis]|uniref:CueP family metal-binding protein n=1 Tax=Paenibacillus yanchengensis TaxID=2035833 RepID=A0ABW4YI46_9BACL
MKVKVWIPFIVMALLLAACGGNGGSNKAEMTEDQVKELVNEYSVGDFKNISASITSDELIITDEKQKKTVYTLPEAEFFVSIAPFENQTHPCGIHSLTGCQGEMVTEEFDVHIVDESGKVIIDEKMATLENGFIDLWLPRDQKYQVTIKQGDKQVTSEITTFKGDNTCITTMQLL